MRPAAASHNRLNAISCFRFPPGRRLPGSVCPVGLYRAAMQSEAPGAAAAQEIGIFGLRQRAAELLPVSLRRHTVFFFKTAGQFRDIIKTGLIGNCGNLEI